MLRALVTGGFLILAGVVIWIAFLMGPESGAGNLFTNLGTESGGTSGAAPAWDPPSARARNRLPELVHHLRARIEYVTLMI